MPTYRILRCANAHLYTAATVLVIAAAVYVLCCKDTLWQQIAAAAAAVITPAWAAYYALLRITVTETGVTRRSLTGTTSLSWGDITTATLQETQNQGTASCTILLESAHGTLRLSSDLLPLEEVQELAKELREIGILH